MLTSRTIHVKDGEITQSWLNEIWAVEQSVTSNKKWLDKQLKELVELLQSGSHIHPGDMVAIIKESRGKVSWKGLTTAVIDRVSKSNPKLAETLRAVVKAEEEREKPVSSTKAKVTRQSGASEVTEVSIVTGTQTVKLSTLARKAA